MERDPVLSTRGLPVYVNGIKQTVDHYTPDEQEELNKQLTITHQMNKRN
jgi:hypothetical protein